MRMSRRRFLTFSLAAAGAGLSGAMGPLGCGPGAKGPGKVKPVAIPRWRGFNLTEKFTAERNRPFVESDFQWIAQWGFDFVRLPMDYRCYTDPGDWMAFREEKLREIDQAVEFGKQYRVHVNLNLHRAPGYCVNPPDEPRNLFQDEEALRVCAHHWKSFAQRYEGIPNERLSFNLLNEPGSTSERSYERVVRHLVAAIREADPQRLIVADGLRWARDPVPSLADLGIAQSARGYDPMQISHYGAPWITGSAKWPKPTWPLTDAEGRRWDKDALREHYRPWVDLKRSGIGVHVGEMGAFNRAPHDVVLSWMKDLLSVLRENEIGWALWNLRSSFGVVDSGREDVRYEDMPGGHKLDRAMLDVLTSA
jgi:endoglucanase